MSSKAHSQARGGQHRNAELVTDMSDTGKNTSDQHGCHDSHHYQAVKIESTRTGGTCWRVLIAEGVASPAARDLDVDDVIRAIVDQGFLDEGDAPVKVR